MKEKIIAISIVTAIIMFIWAAYDKIEGIVFITIAIIVMGLIFYPITRTVFTRIYPKRIIINYKLYHINVMIFCVIVMYTFTVSKEGTAQHLISHYIVWAIITVYFVYLITDTVEWIRKKENVRNRYIWLSGGILSFILFTTYRIIF